MQHLDRKVRSDPGSQHTLEEMNRPDTVEFSQRSVAYGRRRQADRETTAQVSAFWSLPPLPPNLSLPEERKRSPRISVWKTRRTVM